MPEPIQNRINSAYIRALSLARDAVISAIEAGNLLIEQRAKVMEEGGQWLVWLATNCPDIHERTARKLMTSAIYVQEHGGYVAAETVKQLYLEAGAIKEDDNPSNGAIKPADMIIGPLMRSFDRYRLFYTDEKIDSIKPGAVPHFLSWVRKTKDELIALEAKVVKRFGEAKVK